MTLAGKPFQIEEVLYVKKFPTEEEKTFDLKHSLSGLNKRRLILVIISIYKA